MLKLKYAVAALIFAGAAPAYADLLRVPALQVPGAGLGAVSTLVTVQDNNLPSNSGNSNGIESGCVTYAGSLSSPGFSCQYGVEGGDNQAINGLHLGSSIAGLTSAGQLGLVINISEDKPGDTAMLTNLYLSLYNLKTATQMVFLYNSQPLELGNTGGVGQAGDNLFMLDAGSATAANSFCPDLSQCVIGGGIQFARGSTSATSETLYVGALNARPAEGNGNPVPEPVSLALLGLGLAGIGAVRRRG